MRFIPFDHQTIIVTLENIEITNRLRMITSDSILDNKAYIGTIQDNKFELFRKILYRNSWLPLIRGSITEANGKTKIELYSFPNYFGLGVTILGLILEYYAICKIINELLLNNLFGISTNNISLSSILFLMGFMLFTYLLMLCAYKLEASSTIKYLLSLFSWKTNAIVQQNNQILGFEEIKLFSLLFMTLITIQAIVLAISLITSII
jgi:hypothetical protein